MSGIVVDTSSWIEYFNRGEHAIIDEALAEGRVYVSGLIAAELTSGKLTTRHRSALESLLGDLPLVQGDLQHWFRVGQLRATLLTKGLTVSTPDAHVAQCALDLQAELLTEDAVFTKIARKVSLQLFS
ncbi:PIN domain-containing protein [Nitrospira sp. M1]